LVPYYVSYTVADYASGGYYSYSIIASIFCTPADEDH
jgi:hypothetical protein